MGISITALIAGLAIAAFLIPEGVWQFVTIIGLCIVFLIPCFYALKLEVSVGAYKCKKCGHEIVPSYREAGKNTVAEKGAARLNGGEKVRIFKITHFSQVLSSNAKRVINNGR